jgi:hypothetical protein
VKVGSDDRSSIQFDSKQKPALGDGEKRGADKSKEGVDGVERGNVGLLGEDGLAMRRARSGVNTCLCSTYSCSPTATRTFGLDGVPSVFLNALWGRVDLGGHRCGGC